MTSLHLDTISVPSAIKQKIIELSKTITFEKQSPKGANSWLFFGVNNVLKQKVAVKFYDWSGDVQYHAEPRYLMSIKSENIIQILDAALVDEDYAYFMTPFLNRGDLDDELSRGMFGNLRAINYVRAVLSGLSHLHGENLLHRDLKAQNILVSSVDNCVIGDFGSVKKLPEGHDTVPGSGHSLIYRPPESIESSRYGIRGDIYQVGLLLYQLLGGSLPYGEMAWLNKRQFAQYRSIDDPIDQQIFANEVIQKVIQRGHVIDNTTLPEWVCAPLKRLINKACHIDPNRRFSSCSDFLSGLSRIRGEIHDWRVEDGCPTRHDRICYRIVRSAQTNKYFVQKRGKGEWRQDSKFCGKTIADLIEEIENKIASKG